MFDIGFWEVIFIFVLLLLVVGPERLPGLARTAGLWIRKARRYVEGVREDVEQEFNVSELKRMMHNQEVQINDLQSQISNYDPLADEQTDSSSKSSSSPSEYDIIEEETDEDDPGKSTDR